MMSKIGKQLIEIPEGVEVKFDAPELTAKGPMGENRFFISPKISVLIENNKIRLQPRDQSRKTKALWGTTRAIIANQIKGVSKLFQADLILEGLGYTASVSEDELTLRLGYSHLVKIKIPQDLKVEAKAGRGLYLISVKGTDKQKVGNFAGSVRKLKPACPYKGKGFRYAEEVLKKKPIKKTMVSK